MADQAAPQNYGNETFIEFCARPEWAAAYGNPDGDDTFASLNICTNAVWARAVRDSLKQINEAFACRHDTPLLLKLNDVAGGKDWRPSDDDAYAIQAGDFAAASVLVPDHFFTFDRRHDSSLSSMVILQHDQTDGRVYTYTRMHGRPGTALGTDVVGMRTFSGSVAFSSLFDAAISDNPSVLGSITVRVPEWPQANDGITLLAIMNRSTADDTGSVNRPNFEFGLGRGSLALGPEADPQSYFLFLRYRNGADAETHVFNLLISPDDLLGHGLGITPGYEWTLGFNRYEKTGLGNLDWTVDFYVNGQFVYQQSDLSPPAPGTSTSSRFLIGGGPIQQRWAGGPIRNVMLKSGRHEPSAVSPLMQFLYQKGAGYI